METLQKQVTIMEEMKKLMENFKKDGKSRKTVDYMLKRIDGLDKLWFEFKKTHDILSNILNPDHTYFTSEKFEEIQQFYYASSKLLRNTLAEIETSTSYSDAYSDADAKVKEPQNVGDNENNYTSRNSSNPSRGNMTKLEEMMRKQSSNFKAFSRALSSIDVDQLSEKWEYEDALTTIKARWKVVDTLHWEIDSEAHDRDEAYEDRFSEHEKKFIDIKKAISSKLWSVTYREKSTPQLDIPVFNGNYQQWVSFKDLFNEAIHNNNSLSHAQKMQFLKGKLRGEPERLIQHLQISSENYLASWEILNHRYNNRKLIFTSHINTIMNLSTIQQPSSHLIKRLHDVTKECLNAIKNLGVNIDNWDPILVHILSQKLDVETHNDYMTSLKHPRELPILSEFLEFLENKFTTLESSRRKQENGTKSSSNAPSTSYKQEKSYQYKNYSSNKAISNYKQENKYRKLNCPVCNSNEHNIYYCNQFLEQTAIQKKQTITKLNYCYNCLYSHNGKPCTSNKRCRQCNGCHNSILHDAFISSPSNANVSENKLKGVHVTERKESPEILLATAIINVQGVDGTYHMLRALVDQGSQISLITENAAQLLGLPRNKCSGSITGIGTKTTSCKGVLKLNCSSLTEKYHFDIDVYIMKSLTRNLPHSSFAGLAWEQLSDIKLADPEYNICRPIDILLGADIYGSIILHGIRRANVDNPSLIAQHTRLGWILCGKAQTMQCNIVINDLEEIQRFWQIEDVSSNSPLKENEDECIKYYKETTTRLEDGRYQVRLPLQSNIAKIGKSRPTAIAQFFQLERKLKQDAKTAEQYKLFIKEYSELGHMTRADRATQNLEYFMPHHCVIREDSTTTKLRVVFNASQKTSNGTSLNDYMYKGPNLQKDLLELIMRWRQYKIVFTADIEKMFRQIWVHPDDQCYQKIMWRDDASEVLQEYQLTTVTYGTKAAPFLAMMTLHQLAEDEREAFPEAAKVVENCFYMDDLLHGAHTIQKAKTLKQDLIKLLKTGGLNLRKWNSNYQELLKENTEFHNQENYIFHQPNSTKTLGVLWNPNQDVFIFQSKIEPTAEDKTRNTKRKLLSDISRLFDPLGWLTPVSTKLKILFQLLWDSDIKWDDEIPTSINLEWLKIRQDMTNINKIKIPRWLGTMTASDIELHGFCDASQKAYACVIYSKLIENGKPKITLVSGKSKLVPRNKQTTLPRLELCGAHLLSKLMLKTRECLSGHNLKIYGWVDSTAVLGWLQGNPDRWTTFVTNRVRQITDVIPPSSWHYIKSADNPADCASRGLTVTQLVNHPLWWQAPSWLTTYENKPHTTPMLNKTNEEEKQEKQVYHISKQEKSIEEELLCKFSSYSKVVRVLAWVRRFLKKKEDRHQESYLTLKELKQAKMKIIKRIQEIEFREEISSLQEHKRLPSKSKLLNLTPFLDEQGLLRVGGRLKNAQINMDMKNPIIIPYESRLTQLIIDDAHKLTLHGGARVTLALIRQKYWLISGNRATKKYIRQCVTCKKYNPHLQEQIMGNLPSARVNPSRPFLHTGVDYTGHIFVKANKGRGIKTSKGYVAVFVCMATKAVHLELVSDLSTSAFIAALRRMAARRGTPSHLYSDNGTNFVGANRILQEEYQEIQQTFNDDLMNSLTDLKITWHFNAPSWPSANGLFEAAVKSFKFHFKRVVGEQRLTFEEYSTLLTQIEACMNSRPLCALSEDPEDLNYLTPAHFLSGGPTLTLIETERDMRTRWHLTQKIYQDIWKRWRAEYLTQLTSRSKWRHPNKNININDVVLIHDDNLPPGKWNMGRVIDLHPGQDSFVRVVTLKTRNGHIRRPITKLSILVEDKYQPDCKLNYHENKKPEEKKSNKTFKKNLSTICTAILFFMTLLSSSDCKVNTTKLRENQALYFDKISNMQLITNEWKIVVYYEMQPYRQGIHALNNYIESLNKICDTVKVECTSVLLQLHHGITDLEYYNQLFVTNQYQERAPGQRTRRGLINAIENIASDLFGVLDERFALKYETDISLIKANQKHMALLWKNQTSLIEAENNILQRTEVAMNEQHKVLNQHIIAIEKAINNLKESVQANTILNRFTIGAIIANNMLSNLKTMQNELLDTITDVYHGRINLHLLTPNQISSELSIISSQLPKDVTLPIDNVHQELRKIYSLLSVRTRMLEDYLIFEIRLPLINRDTFEIFKLIPIPKYQDGKSIRLVPVSDYISINIKKDTYISMTENDIKECQVQSATYFCRSRKPEYHMMAGENLCQLDTTECKMVVEPCKDLWTETNDINTYVYYCCDICNVRAICMEEMTAHQLQGSGLITIGHGCLLKSDKMAIYPYKSHSSEIKIMPDLYTPIMAPINNVINITLPRWSNYNHSLADLYHESDQLGKKINSFNQEQEQVIEEADSLSHHDIHHYVMIYVILGLIGITGMIIIIRKVHRHWQVPPVSGPLEPSYTPPVPRARRSGTTAAGGDMEMN